MVKRVAHLPIYCEELVTFKLDIRIINFEIRHIEILLAVRLIVKHFIGHIDEVNIVVQI